MRRLPIDERHATPQAWRRLRREMTEGELRDIAIDIAAATGGHPGPIFHALALERWEELPQAWD